MLVLTRDEGSSVLIGERVTVTLKRLGMDMAELCVTCPPELAVQVSEPGQPEPPTTLPPDDAGTGPAPPPGGAHRVQAVLRPGQALAIGPDITVTVERIYNPGGHQPRARLGFRAPKELFILRQEIARKPAPSPPGAAAGAASRVGRPEKPAQPA
jgi:sRNA-binding carbon storage regulator CsrA